MTHTLPLLAALLLAPLAELRAAEPAVPSPVKTGVILVNHVGFPPNAAKHCVIPSPPQKEFSVHRMKSEASGWTQVFSGTLTEGGGELEPGWIGDFSALREEGIYQVQCGSWRSRAFSIHAGVYDLPMRVIFNYFTLARCGDKTGKSCTGPCHLNDGNLVGVGHRDFSGGYHQSSDLRKWPAWEVQGLLGLVHFGQLQTPHWDKGIVAEEVRWGCDYFQKLVREDGGMFDSVFIPLGWGARDYYPTDPPIPALWDTVRHQAQAAAYFQTRDAAYAAKCQQTAERVWRYMTSERRPKARYQPPAIPPRGHEALKTTWDAFYVDSAADLAYRIGAALALWRVTGDAALLDDAARSASKLLALQASESGAQGRSAAVFWEGPEGDRLASTSQGWQASVNNEIALALCELIQSAPHHPDAERWRGAVRVIAESECAIARRNAWGLVSISFSLRDKAFADEAGGVLSPDRVYPAGSIRSRSGGAAEKSLAYQYRPPLYHRQILLAGLFLNRAAEITGNPECRVVAQRQLDWVMGSNPFDASAIEGVGYNQPLRGIFGEFFPPTPQIPGAVTVGLQHGSFDPNLYGNCGANEYDMPPAGAALGLMAEQVKQS